MPFEKGKSGNPSGRPKEAPEVRELARQHTKEAIERLVFWLKSDNPKASVTAAMALLDRGFGRAHQSVEITGEVTNFVVRAPEPAINSEQWQNQNVPAAIRSVQ